MLYLSRRARFGLRDTAASLFQGGAACFVPAISSNTLLSRRRSRKMLVFPAVPASLLGPFCILFSLPNSVSSEAVANNAFAATEVVDTMGFKSTQLSQRILAFIILRGNGTPLSPVRPSSGTGGRAALAGTRCDIACYTRGRVEAAFHPASTRLRRAFRPEIGGFGAELKPI